MTLTEKQVVKLNRRRGFPLKKKSEGGHDSFYAQIKGDLWWEWKTNGRQIESSLINYATKEKCVFRGTSASKGSDLEYSINPEIVGNIDIYKNKVFFRLKDQK